MSEVKMSEELKRLQQENEELRGALSSLNVATLNECADYRGTNLSRYVNKLLSKNDQAS